LRKFIFAKCKKQLGVSEAGKTTEPKGVSLIRIAEANESMSRRSILLVFSKIVSVMLVGGTLALNLGCSSVETKPFSADQREQLKEKVDQVVANGALNPVLGKTTRFTEAEINSILNSQIGEWISNGISEPQVRFLGNNRFSLRMMVDIDEFKRRRKRQGGAGPLNFLTGKIPALVRGELISGEGKSQFKLQATEVNGIPIPRALALELLSSHSKKNRHPEGFNLERPFDLPVKIRRLEIISDELIVIQ